MLPTNITIREVAKAAGVSVSTVSRVLNDKEDVAPATYARVRQVIEELGYMSSLAAQSMRSHKTHVIGVLITDLSASFSLEIVRGLGLALQALDYDLIIYSSGRMPGSDAAWARKHITRLNSSITDGLIVIAPATANLPTGGPLVVIDPHEGMELWPSVLSANRAAAQEAVAYLVALGHRRIGFAGGRDGLVSAGQRRLGYLDALAAAEITPEAELIVAGDYSYDAGFAAAQRLLTLAAPPTAVFAANDLAAKGVMDAAHRAGMSVPDDLSVVGFDDIPEAAHFSPRLTTVAQPIHEMASVATTMLVDLIRGRSLPTPHVELPARLVLRDSCRSPAPKLAAPQQDRSHRSFARARSES